MTSILSKVFGCLVADDLWNAVVCFQPPSLLIGKVWVIVVHFCMCPSALESGLVARNMLIDFNPALALVGSTIWDALLRRCCRFCGVYIDTISIKSITACYGGRLSE